MDDFTEPTTSEAVRAAIAGFAEDDPRRPPYLLDERLEAAGDVVGKLRWHSGGADWLAVRLQYGRGVPVTELCEAFDIAETTLRRRADKEDWRRLPTPRDAQRLARRVWLGGLARGASQPADVARLLEDSTWQPIEPAIERPLFIPEDKHGAYPTTRTRDIPHGAGNERTDSRFEQRVLVTRRLDALIADLERDLAEGEAAQEDAAGDCKGGAPVAVDPGRPGNAGGGVRGVEDMGGTGAAAT